MFDLKEREMHRTVAGGLVVLVAVTSLLIAADDRKPPEPQPIELSGRLIRPPKWTPQLELVPAGEIKRFDVTGALLNGIEDGTPIRVKGVVSSPLHLGGSRTNPSPFPAQWIIELEVTEVEVLDDPLDPFTEARQKANQPKSKGE
jgi:hypothetical protein